MECQEESWLEQEDNPAPGVEDAPGTGFDLVKLVSEDA
jgi:hypothetical protein